MTEIFLIADPAMSTDAVLGGLAESQRYSEIAALLIRRGELSDEAYQARVRAITGPAQRNGAAVLVEGAPALVRQLGVDGLHVHGGIGAVRAAVAALKPDFIVGAGDVNTRDDAMLKGESGVDYIQFGPTSGSISAEARELARWWAETMEVPSVLTDPEASLAAYEDEGCEFIGLPVPAAGTQP